MSIEDVVTPMVSLTRPLSAISFASREVENGVVVGNQCGRDFLYYGLHFLRPAVCSIETLSPQMIDTEGLFGSPVPPWLAFTILQFSRAPEFLRSLGIAWSINGVQILNYRSLVKAILLARMSYDDAMTVMESRILADQVVGIDISLGWGGLLDHVVFVYGYDAEALYVFDTHQVTSLEYEPLYRQHYFRLPRSVVKRRWTKFGRVWTLDEIN